MPPATRRRHHVPSSLEPPEQRPRLAVLQPQAARHFTRVEHGETQHVQECLDVGSRHRWRFAQGLGPQCAGVVAPQAQTPFVDASVVSCTKYSQIRIRVVAPIFPGPKVVNVYPKVRAALRHSASVTVTV